MKALLERVKIFRHIIWDWNGTLLDDVTASCTTLNELLSEYGLPNISLEEYRRKFCFPIETYYERVGFDLEKYSFDEISEKWHRRYGEHFDALCSLYPETEQGLSDVSKEGIGSSILSAAGEENIKNMLGAYRIEHFFENVSGGENSFKAEPKLTRGMKLIERLSLEPGKVVLIGDTQYDAEVAQRLGVSYIVVSDGHQHPDTMQIEELHLLKSRY